MTAKIAPMQEEHGLIKHALEQYVVDKYEAGDGYEDDDWKATKVVSHKRTWDVDKLGKLVPRGIFKNLVKITVDGTKVDQYVAAGTLSRKVIEPAFTEVPNTPYVKVTKREQNAKKGADEAESLAAKLA